VLGVWRGIGTTSLAGNLLCLGAAASYGLGFPYTRRYLAHRREGPLALATAQLICAAVEIALLTVLFTGPPHALAAKHLLSILALGAIGTGLTFMLNYSLIRDLGATVTSAVAYVMLIVSTCSLRSSRRPARSALDEVRSAPLPAGEPAAGDGLLARVELDRIGPVRVQVAQE
jgi:drug/metabolite transporter (DMT)-like permease